MRRFHAIWLRDNATDGATRSEVNGQRLITLWDIPQDTRIAKATIIDGALDILFVPEAKSVRFASIWLLENAYDRRTGIAAPHLPESVEAWDAALDPAALTEDFSAISEQPKALCTWLG